MTPFPKVPDHLASYILAELYRSLPPPLDGRPETREARDLVAMTSIANLGPATTLEAQLATNAVIAQALSRDALIEAREKRGDFKVVMQCRAQSALMMRQSAQAMRELRLVQRMREIVQAEKRADEEAEARRSVAQAEALRAVAEREARRTNAHSIQHRIAAEPAMGPPVTDIADRRPEPDIPATMTTDAPPAGHPDTAQRQAASGPGPVRGGAGGTPIPASAIPDPASLPIDATPPADTPPLTNPADGLESRAEKSYDTTQHPVKRNHETPTQLRSADPVQAPYNAPWIAALLSGVTPSAGNPITPGG